MMTHDEFIEFLKNELYLSPLLPYSHSLPYELCYLIISFLPRADIIGESDITNMDKIKHLTLQIISPVQYISGRIATIFSTIVKLIFNCVFFLFFF